jgi:hypothetical protein
VILNLHREAEVKIPGGGFSSLSPRQNLSNISLLISFISHNHNISGRTICSSGIYSRRYQARYSYAAKSFLNCTHICPIFGYVLGFVGITMLGGSKSVRETGPYSRPGAIARPARRSKAARYLIQVRADLTEHVGGNPTPTQKLLIERIAMTLLRIELMDRDALADKTGTLTDAQAKNYLAWSNTVSRMLRHLGLARPSSGAGDIAFDYLTGLDSIDD